MPQPPNDMQHTVQTGMPPHGNPPTEISMGRRQGSASDISGSGVRDNPSSTGIHSKQSQPPHDSGEPPKPPRDAHGRYVLIALVIAALVATLTGMNDMPQVCKWARWFGCASLVYYAARKGSLATWILISMVLGTEVGYTFSEFGVNLRIFSNIFLRCIKTIIAPLLFSTLVVGIAGHANIKEVGRMGLKALIYFEIVTTLALFVGLAAINITKAGEGIVKTSNITAAEALGTASKEAKLSAAGLEEASKGLAEAAKEMKNPQSLMAASEGLQLMAREISTVNNTTVQARSGAEIIMHAFPENIAKSVVNNEVLQIVVFSVIFGISLAQLPEQKRRPMLSFCESLSDVMFKYTNIVMLIAPLGVGSAIAYTVGSMGLDVLGNLAKLVGTLYVSLLAFIVCVLLPVMLLCRIDIIRFFKAVSEPMTLAFATTSSEAALPKAMEKMEHFGVPRHIVAFVMPTGYSFNLDGTTLYLSLATIFVAQAANIHLSLGNQLLIVFTLMLTSKGVAGMPRASLVILLGAAASFGLPEWPILAILGVDELMDMARTATNVLGNCLASVVVAKWEHQLGPSIDEQSTISVAQLMWDSSTNSVKSINH
ncbi:cation:dicarboxylase symporter family transporter [bacterium]|nr:cation:dicarboxylase symporter family transporter [bacterium]